MSFPVFPRLLIGLSIDQSSRFIRLVLGELRIAFDLRDPRGEGHTRLEVPTFCDENGTQISYATVIAEYLDETYGVPLGQSLIGEDPIKRAKVRQIWRYIEGPVAERVTQPLMFERVHRRASGQGTPDSIAIQRASTAKAYYFKELEGLTDQATWIAGPDLSVADLALAAQLSLLDYLGLIAWAQYPTLADYYRRLKSRPAMRPLLADRWEGHIPSPTYADLDF